MHTSNGIDIKIYNIPLAKYRLRSCVKQQKMLNAKVNIADYFIA